MTWAAYEASTAAGRPVELYEFVYGPNYYRYISGGIAQTKDAATYQPADLSRSKLSSSTENTQSTLTVDGPIGLPVAELFRVQPPAEVVTLTLWGKHLSDPDAQYVPLWIGRVLNAKWSADRVELSCEPIDASLNRNGLRRHYQRGCAHALYQGLCGVSSSAFRSTIASGGYTLSGTALTVPSLAALPVNYFAGGFLQYQNPETNAAELHAIWASSAGVLTLPTTPRNIMSATEIWVHPGCDHTTGAGGCAKFSNILNYGGQPYIPDVNPFGGNSLF